MAREAPWVLVVEDDQDLAALEAMLLEEEGYRVMTAGNGQQALDRVAERMPAVILLDMKMPVMDGTAFASAFRTLYDHAAPIVVVTAADDARTRAAKVGADAWVSKPFDPEEFLRAVAAFAPIQGRDEP